MPRPPASRLLATVAVVGALAVGCVLITPALAATGSAQRIEDGSLSMHNSVTGSIVSLEGMTIGDARTGSVTITAARSPAPTRSPRASPAVPLWCMPCG